MVKYLIEIQNKFILLIFTLSSTLIICYLYKDVLLFLITQMHLNDENLYFIFTDVTELFTLYFHIILFILMQIVLWYLSFHVFTFLSPALYLREFKLAKSIFFNTTCFWFLSISLSSYILIPLGWNFFLSFQIQEGFYFEARVNNFFKFYTDIYYITLTYCQSLAFLFIFLRDVGKNHFHINKYRKFHYYLFLIFSTIITPPDLISQVVVTILICIIYEIILLTALFNFLLNDSKMATN